MVKIGILIRIFDIISIMMFSAFIYAIYLQIKPENEFKIYAASTIIIVFIQQNIFSFIGLYNKDPLVFYKLRIKSAIIGIFITFIICVILAFAAKISSEYSRVWFFSVFFGTLFSIVSLRLYYRSKFQKSQKRGLLARKIAIIGDLESSKGAIRHLQSRRTMYHIVGFFSDTPVSSQSKTELVPCLGGIKDFLSYARQNPIDIALISLPWADEERLYDILRTLKSLPIQILLAPPNVGPHIVNSNFASLSGMPTLTLLDVPLNEAQLLTKMVFDKIGSVCLILLLLPVLILVAIAIRVDSSGPIIFQQSRYGFNNTVINIYKFRTMFVEMTDQNAEKLTTRNDPRITRVGRFLRRTSLDETPQLFNVLFGHMSLVGPRPHAMSAKAANKFYFDVTEEYASRHRISPGITGWAQVNGWRGNTDTEEKLRKRVEFDLYYIENWSLLFDIKVCLLTIVEIFRQRNAH